LRACVAGFSLCSLLPDPEISGSCAPTSASKTGALMYRAPELLGLGGTEQRNPTRKSRASDIYSFGCVCYEVQAIRFLVVQSLTFVVQVFTGNLRFSNLPIPDAINASMKNRRSIQPTSVDDTLWTLVEKCWQVEPTLRPTIGEVVQKLRLDTNRHSDSHPYDWVHWDQGIVSRLRSPILISPVFETPTRLPDNQTLAITDKDTIIA
jgi:serine/threonine protein kinase